MDSTILVIAKEFIPSHNITIRPKDKPWITREIKKIINTRNRLYRRYQVSRDPVHFDVYSRVKTEANMKISEAKLNHKESPISKLEGLQSSPKNFWNAKEIYGTKKGDKIPTLVDGNTQYKTSEEKSNLLANYFASQCQNIAGAEEIESTDVPHEERSLQNISVTEAEVYSELKRLKLGKASGPDGLSNELLKIASRSLAPSMTMLFNKILRSSTYPDLWKRANVSPIYKKGNGQEKNNYRPVSLLSVAGKVLERLVFKRMYTYCMENNLLTWRNSGFKKMDSTTNQLVYIVNSI